MWLFLLFLTVPLIEIGLFIQVGDLIGLWPTLGIVVGTALLGTFLVRTQGFAALGRVQGSFSQMQDPSKPLADGAMILFAGALLLTPGFFTDAFGFLLLFPPFRALAFEYVKKRIKVQTFTTGSSGPNEQTPSQTTIDGDFVDVTPDKPTNDGPSDWTKD